MDGRIILMLALFALGACAPTVRGAADDTTAPQLRASEAVMADGTRLPLHVWPAPDGPKPASIVLALHGFGEHGGVMRDWAPHLQKRNHAIYAIDQRGFGRTRDRGYWVSPDLLASDARMMIALLRERHPDTPVYLLGTSMGAAIALLADAADRTPSADGLVLVAPAVSGWDNLALMTRLALWTAGHSLPWLEISTVDEDRKITDNKAMLARLRADPNVLLESRIDVLYGVVDLMQDVWAIAPDVTTPVIWLHGRKDTVIPCEKGAAFFRQMPEWANDKQRFVLYPDGYHLLLRDLDAATVLDDIDQWLHDPKSAIPSGAETRNPAC